jgi:hypothetical protein|nr:MAG TPA: hypothetical protein [Caudoviricetes sp.]DAX23053.1 MAG TPA: hypothetical protein [Caudoviricetes sp.]
MSLFEIVLGFVLTTMIGFVFVSPIYLIEKYIVLGTLDKYIDNVILKVIAAVAINVLFFLVGFVVIFVVYGYRCE